MPRLLFTVCALLVLATAPAAHAQLYLRLVGEVQGPIDGEVVFGPLTGTAATFSFSLGVTTFFDPSTGNPTGQIAVSPLILMKAVDSATTGICTALRAGERLSMCTLDAYRDNGAGGSISYLRLTLTGARFESSQIAAGADGAASEALSIAFDTLEWRDFVTGEIYTYTMGSTSVWNALNQGPALVTAPNPTTGPTDFAFRVPRSGMVSIEVFDARGRHVTKVFDGEIGAEQGVVTWDGNDGSGRPVANGIYMLKMRAGGWLTTQKMSVLR
jgi:type VI secretion system Hcp family effector